MARHRATPPPSTFKRKASLFLAVMAGAPLLVLGPVSAATAADTTSPPALVQEQTTVTTTAPSTVADVAAEDVQETDLSPAPLPEAPVDPAPVPVDPVPVDPAPVPVDPVPVDPAPVPVDPTPVPPVVPEPVQPAPVLPAQGLTVPVVGVSPVSTVQVQSGSGQMPAAAVDAVSGSRAAALQSVPAQQLANTGAPETNQAVAGLGLAMVGAGIGAVALSRRNRRHGRRAARA